MQNPLHIIGKLYRQQFSRRTRERLAQYVLLTRLDRPIGIYLLLWPTLWALFIAAKGWPSLGVSIVFILGVILMRSAGCVINDYADRKIDKHIARTKDRPITAGRVSEKEALLLFVGLCFTAFILVLFMNLLTIRLSIAAVGLAALYPFMKRYTYLPQVFLGLAFGWAVPMAFAAQTGDVPPIAWLLLTGTVLWATAYDTMYAMVDRADDLKVGVKSTAILFGEADRLIIGAIQLLLILVLLLVGRQAELGGIYYLGLGIASLSLLYQQKLIWQRQPADCMKAFLHNNWFGMAVFLGILGDYGLS